MPLSVLDVVRNINRNPNGWSVSWVATAMARLDRVKGVLKEL